MRRFKLIVSFFLIVALSRAQNTPGTGGWRLHLPYSYNTTVCVLGNQVFCGSPSGIFSYDIADGTVERMSKTTGLSDVEVTLLRALPERNLMVVVYANSNIDIIENGSVFNIADIKLRTAAGEKRINNVTFYGKKAYLSCSFGIVVVDLELKLIVDSYLNLGPGATLLSINDVSVYNNLIYASTGNGIYRAQLSNPFLGSYESWTLEAPSFYSTHSEVYGNNLYAVIDSVLKVYDGISWALFSGTSSKRINDMQQAAGKLVITCNEEIVVVATSGVQKEALSGKYSSSIDAKGRFAMVDFAYGLSLYPGGPFNGYLYVAPNGPFSRSAYGMAYNNGSLWVTGGSAPNWLEGGTNYGVYRFNENRWNNSRSLKNIPDSLRDFINIAVHPFNGQLYLSSYQHGLALLDASGNYLASFNESNSSLQSLTVPGYSVLRTAGLAFDGNQNLWVANHSAVKPISVLTASGSWKSFSVGNVFSGQNYLAQLAIDEQGNKWFTHTREGGILVYNSGDASNPTYDADDTYKQLTKETGKGGLPSNQVNCLALDQNGEMWVGTNAGLCIFSNTDLIFNNPDNQNFDARQIVIKTGLVYSNFLGNETINCIKVDGANRKWIGTANGVWLVSPDGYSVLQNFTAQNSPLLDDNVSSIGIDEKTGEVFFASDKGIISYMGDATEGEKDFKNVRIYPNPVKPGFNGEISIRGLMNNSNVKITDISGNLVYETTANGGFATWNGHNYSGNRVATGVYIVFASDKTGEKSYTGKILFIN